METIKCTIDGWRNETKQAFDGSIYWMVLTFLCAVLGIFGIHRFAAKRIGLGIVFLLTFGFAGLGVIIDLVLLMTHRFKDNKKNYITSNITRFTRVLIFLVLLYAVQWIYVFVSSTPGIPTNFIALYIFIAHTFNLDLMINWLNSITEVFTSFLGG